MFSEAKAEWEAARGFAPEGSPARALAEDNLARIRELTDSPASN
jgi:hypothetical protein